jgi:hypothetical protein
VVDEVMSGNEWLPLNIGAAGNPVSSLGRLAQQLPAAVDASGLAVGALISVGKVDGLTKEG